jgi:exodeoxyribonuclease-5
MDEVKLGEEQKRALNSIIDFIHSDKTAFSLSGYAGTGKTFLVKALIEYLEGAQIDYELCVPTHKAKTVLERFTKRSGMTLHKLLSLSPNIEILNLDFNYLKFLTNNNVLLFPVEGIVVCDESSMVNDDLFDLLIEKADKFKSKVIFIGDKAQLKPVNSILQSKVFQLEDRFTLTKIYRQKEESGLTTVLPILRTQFIRRFEEAIGTEGSLYCPSTMKDFIISAIPSFKKATENSDIMEAKILSYTNSRVEAFNSKMEEILFGKDSEYHNKGLLTAYSNSEFNKSKFWNSMDYAIIKEPEKIDIDIPTFCKLPGYRLTLYDSSYDDIAEVHILSKDIDVDFYNSLAMHIEEMRVKAVLMKKARAPHAGKLWQQYYRIMESFTTPIDLYYDNRMIRKKSFDRGYAVTIHKSQGSSINNVFIDMKSISLCRDDRELRQLQYVAVSRATTNAYILQ